MSNPKEDAKPVVDLKQLDVRNRVAISDEIAKAAGFVAGEFVKVSYDATNKIVILKAMQLVEKE